MLYYPLNQQGRPLNKILLVDDSETLREKVRTLLTKEGYSALSVGNGKEGILCFQKNPDIGLIISDVTMPEVDGIAMCEAIKNISGVNMPPVLMFTAMTIDEVTKARAKAFGVRAWILKPFVETRLLEAVKRFLKT